MAARRTGLEHLLALSALPENDDDKKVYYSCAERSAYRPSPCPARGGPQTYQAARGSTSRRSEPAHAGTVTSTEPKPRYRRDDARLELSRAVAAGDSRAATAILKWPFGVVDAVE